MKEGRLEGGDAFGGALGAVDPLFLLSSLPFVATSVESAQRLSRTGPRGLRARPSRRRGSICCMSRRGRRPGCGRAIRSLRCPTCVRCRYAPTMRLPPRSMHAAGAQATSLSFADAMPRLKDRFGQRGSCPRRRRQRRKLWITCPTSRPLAMPCRLSFTAINAAAYAALPGALRAAVDAAAQATEQQQWARLGTRLEENAARMRANGVTIQASPAAAVQQALREAGAGAVTARVRAWAASGPACWMPSCATSAPRAEALARAGPERPPRAMVYTVRFRGAAVRTVRACPDIKA
ncbi:hypothetical protein ACU4GD_29305 [Cupriavidus basilensis]